MKIKNPFTQILKLWSNISQKINSGNSKKEQKPPYSHCMNCQTELAGMYCHKCGQYASKPVLNMSSFIIEYIDNVFALNSKTLPTVYNLILHPGRLAKEYCAGKYVSYIHPLKLNLFILILFVSIFAIFSTDSKLKKSFDDLTNNDNFIANISFSTLADSVEYMECLSQSPRDTIKLVLSQNTIKEYNQILTVIRVQPNSLNPENDTLTVSAPRILFTDNVIIHGDDDIHRFNANNKFIGQKQMLTEKIKLGWSSLISFFFEHFPLMMLLTVPFLTFAIRSVLRRNKAPKSHFYIFSLYYTAFVELLFFLAYCTILMFDIPFSVINWALLISIVTYLTSALKNAFAIKSWILSAISAIVVNVIYWAYCIIMIILLSITILIVTFV